MATVGHLATFHELQRLGEHLGVSFGDGREHVLEPGHVARDGVERIVELLAHRGDDLLLEPAMTDREAVLRVYHHLVVRAEGVAVVACSVGGDYERVLAVAWDVHLVPVNLFHEVAHVCHPFLRRAADAADTVFHAFEQGEVGSRLVDASAELRVVLDVEALDERLIRHTLGLVDLELAVVVVVLPVVNARVEDGAGRGAEVAVLDACASVGACSVLLEPSAVEGVELLPRHGAPLEVVQHLAHELGHVVVAQTEVGQGVDAILRGVDAVVLRQVFQDLLEHVLEHLLASEVVLLDVLALATREALVEWHEDDAAQDRVGLVAELRGVVQALNHEPAEAEADGCQMLAVDAEAVARHDGLQVRALLDVRADVVLVDDDCARLQKRGEHELATHGVEADAATVLHAHEVADEPAERALAVVTLRAVEERGLVPALVRAYRRADNLPEQVRGLGMVGEVLHPALDVPVRAVAVVVDDHVRSVRIVVGADLGREHVLGAEVHERLVLVVVDAVVHRDEVAVGAARLHRCHGAEEGLALVHPALGDGRHGVADDALDVALVRRVHARVVALVVVHGDGAHVGAAAVRSAVVQADDVVLDHDEARHHVRCGRRQRRDARCHVLVLVGVQHARLDAVLLVGALGVDDLDTAVDLVGQVHHEGAEAVHADGRVVEVEDVVGRDLFDHRVLRIFNLDEARLIEVVNHILVHS